MPYAKKEDLRQWQRENYRFRYLTDEEFVKSEAKRKASWYERNREKVIAKVLARRAALKAAKKP